MAGLRLAAWNLGPQVGINPFQRLCARGAFLAARFSSILMLARWCEILHRFSDQDSNRVLRRRENHHWEGCCDLARTWPLRGERIGRANRRTLSVRGAVGMAATDGNGSRSTQF